MAETIFMERGCESRNTSCLSEGQKSRQNRMQPAMVQAMVWFRAIM